MNKLMCSDIAVFLGRPLVGKDLPIIKPADLANCGSGDIVWVKSYTPERLTLIERQRPSLVICDIEMSKKIIIPHIASNNPRLDFIKVLRKFFAPVKSSTIHHSAIISPGAVIGRNVSIGAYTRIGSKVILGDRCIIGSGVSIEGEVQLGKSCVIKSNSVLGGQGFGFEYDDEDRPVHFPHIGKIILEDHVWLGACTTVELATLGTTRICKGAKIDDLVQVGHNVTVGKNTLIMANVVICGGAIIGGNCWVAPNSVIKEKIRIGSRVTVGLGSVVLKDIEDGQVVAGVPARSLNKNT